MRAGVTRGGWLLATLVCACATVRPTTVSLPRSEHPHADFRDADDAPHPSSEPAYFEWWYYDATFEDGTSATVALYSASMLEDHGPPGVLVNVVDSSGATHTSYQNFTAAELAFGAPGELSVGASSSKKEAGGRVRVTAKGVSGSDGRPLAVELTFTPTMPGFKLGTGEVRFDGKVALGWVVPMPRADVEGTLRIGDETRAVKGFGYHDHNWGELNLQRTMSFWYWGRVASADLTAVYTSVHFREETGLPPLRAMIAGDARELKHVLDPAITAVGERELDAAAREVPSGLFIEGKGARLQLSERKVVEAVDLSGRVGALRVFARLFTRPAYVRTLCDYRWTSSLEGLPAESKGAALVEYMYVWKR